MFEVEIDVANHRLCVTLTGFASLTDVHRFAMDLSNAQKKLHAHRGPHQLLYDVSRASIQSQEVVNALRELVLSTPRTSAFALVNASALAGRQLKRIFSGVDAHLCESRASAIDWLGAQLR